jgi:hypothetical protein
MIEFKNPAQREKALRLAHYLWAGKPETIDVDDAYYSGQRWHRIYKQWRSLKCYDAPELGGRNEEQAEVFYVRFCGQFSVELHVRHCEWKSILEIVATRLCFYATNSLAMSTLMVMSLHRLLRIARELKYGC